MTESTGDERPDILSHVLLPVANKQDALSTAKALEPYQPAKVTVLHVVEKGEGVPDKTPVEQSHEIAEESFEAARTVFPDADDHVTYARDIVGAIFEVAEDVDASAIVFQSRTDNRLIRFLSGDLTLKLITEADRPVIELPHTG